MPKFSLAHANVSIQFKNPHEKQPICVVSNEIPTEDLTIRRPK